MNDEALDPACELAFQVAREGLEANPPIDPPAAMRSFLYVAHLPRRAMTVAQRAVDTDPQFRARVAMSADEQVLGTEAYHWLTRPAGWVGADGATSDAPAARTSAPTPPPAATVIDGAAPAPAPIPAAPIPSVPSRGASDPNEASKATIEDELTSLRSLVDRLADERKVVSSSVTDLETEVERRRRESSELASELEGLKSALADAESERTSLKDSSRRSAARVAELETDLSTMRATVAHAEAEAVQAADRASTSESELAVAEEALSEATANLEAVSAELAAAYEQLDSTKTALVGVEARSSSDLDASRSQIVSLEAERDELRGKAGADEATIAENAAAIAENTETITKLTNERDVARSERDDLSDKLGVAEQARVDLEAQLAQVSTQWQELQVELSGLSEQRIAVERELDALARERETSVASRQALFDELATQLGRVEAERNVLAEQLDQVRGSLDATRSTFKVAATQIEADLDIVGSGIGDAAGTSTAIGEGSRGAESALTDLKSLADSDAAAAAAVIERPATTTPAFVATDLPGTAEAEVGVEAFMPEEAAIEEPAVEDEEVAVDEVSDLEAELEALKADADADTDTDGADLIDEPVAEDEVPAEPMPLDDMLASYGLGSDDLESPSPELSTDSLGEPDEDGDSFASPAVAAPVLLGGGDATDGGLIDDVIVPVEPVAGAGIGRKAIVVPQTIADDPIGTARYVVSVEDVVLLIDGDAVAGMGWPSLSTVERRDALVSYLGDLAADTGAAPDTIFDGSVGEDDALPVSRAVRVRLTASGIEPASALSELVDGYPREWPVAVVTDNPILASDAKSRGAAVLDNAQLLDLFIAP